VNASSSIRSVRIAVLISGGGTTLRNLIQRIEAGTLDAEILLVVSSTSKAGGLQFAERAGVPSAVVRRKDFDSQDAFSAAIFDRCRQAGVDVVVMGGFLKRVTIPEDFANRVINIHPALIPSFCGEGMYGHFVHEAVLDYGAKVSGCTVHFADTEPRSAGARSISPITSTTTARSLRKRPCPSWTTTPPKPSPPGSSRPSAKPIPKSST